MGKREQAKGKQAEYELARILREAGFKNARRGGQAMYQRGSECPDVLGLPYVHIECKAVEKLDLRKAMQQSERDAKDEGKGWLPVVIHKKSRQPWLVSMNLRDWIRIFKAALRGTY